MILNAVLSPDVFVTTSAAWRRRVLPPSLMLSGGRIQLPQMKRMTKYTQTIIPGNTGPPYAMMPSYITTFQSSPVRICTHTHQDHVWHHRSSINMQCLTFMFWILTTKLTVQSSVIRSTTSKQVKMRSVIFNLHHENRIRWDKVKTGGIRWNQVESSGIRIT